MKSWQSRYKIYNNYSVNPSWIWSDKITNERVARVGYSHFISNKGEWNNCCSKFSNRVLPPIFISTILQIVRKENWIIGLSENSAMIEYLGLEGWLCHHTSDSFVFVLLFRSLSVLFILYSDIILCSSFSETGVGVRLLWSNKDSRREH